MTEKRTVFECFSPQRFVPQFPAWLAHYTRRRSASLFRFRLFICFVLCFYMGRRINVNLHLKHRKENVIRIPELLAEIKNKKGRPIFFDSSFERYSKSKIANIRLLLTPSDSFLLGVIDQVGWYGNSVDRDLVEEIRSSFSLMVNFNTWSTQFVCQIYINHDLS